MTAGSIAVPTIIPLKIPQGPKHVVDTRTSIELASGSASSIIYYTLNGTRPNPTQKYGVSHTFTYTTPFVLSTGKITIKAMACLRDLSKESSVVTKTFTVFESLEHSTDDDDDDFEEELLVAESPSQPLSLSAQLRQRLSMNSRSSMLSGGDGSGGGGEGVEFHSTGASPQNLQQYQSTPFTTSSRSLGGGNSTAVASNPSRPVTATIPKPICLYCKYPRSKDASHIFCTHCGSQLPPLPTVDPKPPLQVALCSNCRAHVPLESTSCLVCEHNVLHPTPIPLIQAQASAEHMLKEKTVCLICGTRNPSNNTHCLTCEKPLPPQPATPTFPVHTPPPLPNPTVMRPVSGSSYTMCGVCGRVNVSDARFCDWCGSKPAGSQLSVQCSGCHTPNEWHHRHCYLCGVMIKAPLRPEVELSSTMKMPAHVELDKNAWIPVVEIANRGPELKTLGTQTDGIFYPSARTIGSQKGSEFAKKIIHVSARDRLPKLHSYSAGKGLWRMQVEHVCTHLRAHSQSSTYFQSSIGKPRLGKLLFAEVKAEETTGNIGIQLTFTSKFNQCSSDKGSALRRTSSCGTLASLSSDTQTSTPTQTTPTRAPPLSKSRQHHRRRSRSGSVTRSGRENTLTGATKKLHKELSQDGQGRKEIVNSLIQKGADVNARAPDTTLLSMLSLAAKNSKLNCIGTLVENGAKINEQNGKTGNTALHEAVLVGSSCIPAIEALLGQGADPKLKNKDGLIPCDLAVKLNHDDIVTCFATYVGAGLLDKLYKYQPSLTL